MTSHVTIDVAKLSGIGSFDNNVYILSSGGEAIIIDGSDEAERILEAVRGLTVKAIAQTHNHRDHWQAVGALVAALDVPVYAHPEDPIPHRTIPLNGGETLRIGAVEIRALHTPGHTPGSLCYVTGDRLISGDTLFPGGPGNTFGNPQAFEEIMRSIDRLFSELADGTVVHPGHGADTTIGAERGHVEEWRARGW